MPAKISSRRESQTFRLLCQPMMHIPENVFGNNIVTTSVQLEQRQAVKTTSYQSRLNILSCIYSYVDTLLFLCVLCAYTDMFLSMEIVSLNLFAILCSCVHFRDELWYSEFLFIIIVICLRRRKLIKLKNGMSSLITPFFSQKAVYIVCM